MFLVLVPPPPPRCAGATGSSSLEVILSHNNIGTLFPYAFYGLALQSLDVSANQLTTIPASALQACVVPVVTVSCAKCYPFSSAYACLLLMCAAEVDTVWV